MTHLQKRRIAELLASHIPPDEALLMRNGKYACLVCRHKPTFDTLTTLSIHRDGQKHIGAAHEAMKRKQADREEVERRLQLAQVQGVKSSLKGLLTTPPLLEQAQVATRNALMASAPYSSLAARSRREEEPGREGRVCVGGDGPFFSRKRHAQGQTSAAPQAKHGRSAHTGTSFNQEEQSGASTGTSFNQEEQSGASTGTSFNQEEQSGVSIGQLINTCDEGSTTVEDVSDLNQSMTPGGHSRNVATEGNDSRKGRVGLTKHQQKEYMKYRSSGWLRHQDGSWEKDPNVEFDSDEEPPQL
eukprot:Em0015g379a